MPMTMAVLIQPIVVEVTDTVLIFILTILTYSDTGNVGYLQCRFWRDY